MAVVVQSEQDIKNYIRRSLGEGVVAVELTDAQVQDAVDSAAMLYSQIIGAYKFAKMNINGGGAYSVPTDCMHIAEVYFDLNKSDIYESFDWAGVELGPMSFGMYGGYRDSSGAGGGYSYLVQALNYRDQAKRTLGSDDDWFWDRERRLLCITPSAGASAGSQIAFKYQSTSVHWPNLYPTEYHLFRRWALAEAMLTIGAIRTKYGSLPSAQGDLSLNGESLRADADGMKMTLMEQIVKIRPPLGITAM